jgi:predicted nucleotidyltransferase
MEVLKRKTLTRNLNELIKRTKNAFLPMDIEKIFVHGSYLRGEALPGDLDVMILGKANEAFSQLHEAFSSLSDCHDLV